ncbi:ABC-2 type transporter [compost metagenome]
MLLVMEFFLLAVVGVVSAVAGMVRNSSQLLQVNTLIIMPTCLISGSFFPLSRLPEFIQRLANFTPQKWAILALDRLSGGSGLSGIVLPLAILLLYAVVMIAFGSAVLKPNRKSTS